LTPLKNGSRHFEVFRLWVFTEAAREVWCLLTASSTRKPLKAAESVMAARIGWLPNKIGHVTFMEVLLTPTQCETPIVMNTFFVYSISYTVSVVSQRFL